MKTTRQFRTPRIARLLSVFIVVVVLMSFTAPTASAANITYATPSDIINAVAEQTGLEPDINILVKAGYITSAEQRQFNRYGAFSYAVAWHILLPTFGIYPYPADIYPDIAPHPSWPNGTVYADARAAAILCGLADPETEPNFRITAQDFQSLLSRLQTEHPTLPVYESSCPFVTSVEDAATEAGTEPWNVRTYLGRNSLISAYPLIPESWLTDFATTGYEIHFELPADRPAGAKLDGYKTVGLTNYTDRFLAIADANPKVTLHEFTHYIVKRADIDPDYLRACFDTEATDVLPFIGLYASLSPSEYIAEFVSYWQLNPAEQETLRSLAPNTADLTEYLIFYFQPASMPAPA